jgi:hypothetical protein
MEELSDVHAEFQLYHGAHVNKMKLFEQHRPNDAADNVERERFAVAMNKHKQPKLTDRYSICVQNGLSMWLAAASVVPRERTGAFTAKYGLSAHQLGENFAKQLTMHEVESCPFKPEEIADEYIEQGCVCWRILISHRLFTISHF